MPDAPVPAWIEGHRHFGDLHRAFADRARELAASLVTGDPPWMTPIVCFYDDDGDETEVVAITKPSESPAVRARTMATERQPSSWTALWVKFHEGAQRLFIRLGDCDVEWGIIAPLDRSEDFTVWGFSPSLLRGGPSSSCIERAHRAAARARSLDRMGVVQWVGEGAKDPWTEHPLTGDELVGSALDRIAGKTRSSAAWDYAVAGRAEEGVLLEIGEADRAFFFVQHAASDPLELMRVAPRGRERRAPERRAG